MNQTALLVVDVQDSFQQRPSWLESDHQRFSTNVNQLITSARQQDWQVVYVLHNEEEGIFSPESGFVRLMNFLQPEANEPVFNKKVHNALTDSGLHQWLQDKGITQLKVCGIRTEQCCETTTRVASDLGYQVDFVLDATLTFPMVDAITGEAVSAQMLYQRTATVLKDRFAHITQVADYTPKL